MRETPLRNAKLVAFGSTRRVGGDAASDPALRAVLESETPAVTLVGKSSALQVREVLETTEEENLAMIADSVRLLVEQGREVIFDAEHFFDGYADDPRYAIATLRAAAGAGAGTVALCDTNGGSMPGAIVEGVGEALRAVDCAIGIHVHNDADLAVANTLLAVQAGATQVQACLNGWGERCGNANIISVIANLKLKLGLDVVSDEQLARLTELSHFASELANLAPNPQQPYVGTSAFAHKAGLHVAAIMKSAGSYTHVEPGSVGNIERVLVSELSGRRNIVAKLAEESIDIELSDDQARALAEQVKEQEAEGLPVRVRRGLVRAARAPRGRRLPPALPPRGLPHRGAPPSPARRGRERDARRGDGEGERRRDADANGGGGERAGVRLDAAVRSALSESFPDLERVHLVDYKVRIINPARRRRCRRARADRIDRRRTPLAHRRRFDGRGRGVMARAAGRLRVLAVAPQRGGRLRLAARGRQNPTGLIGPVRASQVPGTWEALPRRVGLEPQLAVGRLAGGAACRRPGALLRAAPEDRQPRSRGRGRKRCSLRTSRTSRPR